MVRFKKIKLTKNDKIHLEYDVEREGLELCKMDKCPEMNGSEKPPVRMQTAETMELF